MDLRPAQPRGEAGGLGRFVPRFGFRHSRRSLFLFRLALAAGYREFELRRIPQVFGFRHLGLSALHRSRSRCGLGSFRRRHRFALGHAGAKGVYEIGYARRGDFPRWFDPLASLFLLQQIDERVLVVIFELRRIEMTRLRLHDMGSQVEHLL